MTLYIKGTVEQDIFKGVTFYGFVKIIWLKGPTFQNYV